MKAVLVEPYRGGSHQAWADGLAANSAHDVSVISHPARFWKWRMHGAFLTLAEGVARHVDEHGRPDVILASSMMDVAAFAGAIRLDAPGVPIAVYFHESQFTYPLSPADKTDLTYAMKNWASAATSDLVVFNSDYHRTVFFEEARRFLNTFPENKHTHRIDEVHNDSIVLPVGIDLSGFLRPKLRNDVVSDARTPLIVWNHRWEHDKGPDELCAIVRELIERGVEFEMAMCGEVFISVPPEFAEVTDLLGDRLVHEGWAERDRYVELLSEASVVLSTAHQEFFGIGVVEGIAAGAHPILPDRLVYPERIGAIGADPVATLYDSPSRAADLIERALNQKTDPAFAESVSQYDWPVVARHYDETLSDLAVSPPGS